MRAWAGEARATAAFDYTIRESNRARHVRLVVSGRGGVEVVLPRGFDRRLLPPILERKAAWVERARARAALQVDAPVAAAGPPPRVELPAVGRAWPVEYRPTAAATVALRERAVPGCGRLLVASGAVDDPLACRAALRRWLVRAGREHLTPWLEELAEDGGFGRFRVSIRTQRSRWGSCSRRGTISLNAALLLLPRDLAGHILLHELCHTVHLDHSPRFWSLLSRHDPGCDHHRRQLRTAWRYVPEWAQPQA